MLLLVAGLATAISFGGTSYGVQQISVATGKPAYHYGESFSFSISVSNVTGGNAVLEIVDESNQSSSPINIMITKPVSNITAPVPFYRTTFEPGTYILRVNYGGENASTTFQLVDSGNIAIPPQFKEVAGSWSANQTTTTLFGRHIVELITSGTIKVEGFQEHNMTVIPSWFKSDAKWWSDGKITDNEFGQVIEYLIQSDIMKV